MKLPFKKIDAYIEIVGSSDMRLNAMARDTRLTIAAALRKRYTRVGITIIDNLEDLEALVAKKPDLVVLGMKLILLDLTKGYEDSLKMWLSTYLAENDIAYTGSDKAALLLQLEKHQAKQRIIDAGLRSSAFFISTITRPIFTHNLRYPLFVKPTHCGGSMGIDEQSVVYSETDLKAKIQSIHTDCRSDALIEEYLPGREFSVAVTRHLDTDNLLAMPIEIVAPTDTRGNSFLSESVKDADTERVLPVNDLKLKNTINAAAINIFKALGARDYGRIDLRLDGNGNPSFMEANLMPGLSNHGYLSRCFYLNQHISYQEMIITIVELALMRRKSAPEISLSPDFVEALTTELVNVPPVV